MNIRAIVLDANILVRAVLGSRVRGLIMAHLDTVKFFAPEAAFADARKHLPALLSKRGVPVAPAMAVLEQLAAIIQPIDAELYLVKREAALLRIGARDADDWPVRACAMVLGCPVWTEDADFFGSGVATSTTDRIALYLRPD